MGNRYVSIQTFTQCKSFFTKLIVAVEPTIFVNVCNMFIEIAFDSISFKTVRILAVEPVVFVEITNVINKAAF